MPSLRKTLRKWYWTVRGLMKSWAPISGFRRRETAAFGLRVTADLVFASDELRRWLVVERENDLLTLDAFSVSRGR
jgi:hypothetical protein